MTSFSHSYIPDIVRQLTLEEKILLLGAPNWWNTTAIERLQIPSVRMSDGPNGVRGSSHFVSTPAQCIPCATSLASTFDEELLFQVGKFMGEEAKLKSAVLLLAPTCNIQRSPLGGRSFESFSEDPFLSGMLASSYIKGLQSQGVSAAIKHFVGNDQEDHRTSAESVMSDRALREIYLLPFMLAQKHAKPGAYMTSYGRVKGVHCSENAVLIKGILRGEWSFEGIVISDWYGTYGTDQPLNAGLDLEMPGPPRWRSPTLVRHCLSAGKLSMRTIDDRVANLLKFVQKQAQRNPDIVYGDGLEQSRDSADTRQFCRRLAADGMVLLKNRNQLLPLSTNRIKRLAVIGPNARQYVISGGGSAALKATYVVNPWDGLTEAAPEGLQISYELGCYAHKYLPTLENSLWTPTGERGWTCTFYNHDSDGNISAPIHACVLQDTRIKLNDFLPDGLTPCWSIRLKGMLVLEKTCTYELGLTVAGKAKLWIDGNLTIDNWTSQTPGDFFYGQGTVEEKATIRVLADTPVEVLVEYTNTLATDGEDKGGNGLSQPALMRGVRFGGCEKIDPDQAIEAASAMAADCDAVLFIGGLSPEWESEGFDRTTLDLPGRQNEVIASVASANPNTIVCIQAGSAVSMPWLESVNSVVQAWYSGNEIGHALADVIYGEVNPSGRLPLTFPGRLEDIPAYLNHRSENNQIYYREDVFVGYKYYQAKKLTPLFPFGFGLSYTTFSFCEMSATGARLQGQEITVTVTIRVRNDGPLLGSEVVQVYITYPVVAVTVPVLQLKGFGKVRNVKPGETAQVEIRLDKYAFSFWNVETSAWEAAAGDYVIHVGRNCEDLPLSCTLKLSESLHWSGL